MLRSRNSVAGKNGVAGGLSTGVPLGQPAGGGRLWRGGPFHDRPAPRRRGPGGAPAPAGRRRGARGEPDGAEAGGRVAGAARPGGAGGHRPTRSGGTPVPSPPAGRVL